jgi:uncharacterized protein (DUF427 family)
MPNPTKQHLEPGPDHPITITPTGGTVVVRAGGRVIARSTGAVTLQESTYPAVHYVPLADVDPAVLRPSTTETYCPFKGDASYFSVETPEGTIEDAVWRYEDPYPAVAEIAGKVAFYRHKVEVTVDAGR